MKKNYKNQYGRTMVETLGVLALFGLLSIMAIYGFEYMLNKHKANEVWNELKSRAMTLSMQYTGNIPYNLSEYKENVQGMSMALAETEDTETFAIKIENMNQKVCEMVLKEKPEECIEITTNIDDSTAPNYPSNAIDTLCSGDNLTLFFIYNGDLSALIENESTPDDSTTQEAEQEQGGIIQNCILQNNITNACVSCASGYQLSSDGIHCTENATCNETTDCTGSNRVCQNGKCECGKITGCGGYNANCGCVNCAVIENCEKQDSLNCQCLSCNSGYRLSNNSCISIASDTYACANVSNMLAHTAMKESYCPSGYHWATLADIGRSETSIAPVPREYIISYCLNNCQACASDEWWLSDLASAYPSGYAWALGANGYIYTGYRPGIALFLCAKN